MAPFVALAYGLDDVRRFDGREILFAAETKYFVRFEVLSGI
jgi:hypothetical protein